MGLQRMKSQGRFQGKQDTITWNTGAETIDKETETFGVCSVVSFSLKSSNPGGFSLKFESSAVEVPKSVSMRIKSGNCLSPSQTPTFFASFYQLILKVDAKINQVYIIFRLLVSLYPQCSAAVGLSPHT